MKKIILIVLLFFMPVYVKAAEVDFWTLYDNYLNDYKKNSCQNASNSNSSECVSAKNGLKQALIQAKNEGEYDNLALTLEFSGISASDFEELENYANNYVAPSPEDSNSDSNDNSNNDVDSQADLWQLYDYYENMYQSNSCKNNSNSENCKEALDGFKTIISRAKSEGSLDEFSEMISFAGLSENDQDEMMSYAQQNGYKSEVQQEADRLKEETDNLLKEAEICEEDKTPEMRAYCEEYVYPRLKENQEAIDEIIKEVEDYDLVGFDSLNDYSNVLQSGQLPDGTFSVSVGCGDIYGGELGDWINNVFSFVKYAGLALVVLLTTMDFLKVVTSDKDDSLNNAFSRFVKRCIAVILLFLTPVLINFVFDLLGDNIKGSDGTVVDVCIDYIK